MKKKFVALSLIFSATLAGGALSSCSNNEPIVDEGGNENDNEEEKITGVVISGPLSVNVGENITLVADVLGSNDDSVNWSVNESSVASIDQNGKLTGLAEGKVVVTATSVKAPEFSANYEVSVREIDATGIELVVETNEDIYLQDGVYYVPGGQEFKISYKLVGGSRKPDGVSYSFSYADGTSATSADCLVTPQEDGSALVRFNAFFEGGVISASASYASSVGAPLVNALRFTSYDKNSENSAKLKDIIQKIGDREVTNLTKAKQTVTRSNSTKVTTFDVYKNQSYATIATETNSTTGTTNETTNTFATIDTSKNAMYYFSYDDEKKIDEMYVNTIYRSEEATTYSNYSSLPTFIDGYATSYGFNSLFSQMVTTSPYAGQVSFGDFTAGGNTNYTFEENHVKLVSDYTDEFDTSIYIEFELTYNLNYEISSYTYKYGSKDSSGKLTISYEEKGSDFVYGNKDINSDPKINISDYYIQDFDIEYIENYAELIQGQGADNSRYTYDEFIKGGYNGNDYYSTSYNRSLPFKITNFSPITGSTLIDVASIKIVNNINGSRDNVIFEDGSAIFAAPKGDDGNFIPSIDTITFTTRGGASKTIVIEWTKPELNALNFDCPDVQSVNTTYKFPDIRPYKETNYFWLNADPDDSIYTFKMEITKGANDGLTLVENEASRTKPTGSYSIVANTPGDYEFYFYVEGSSDVRTKTYSLKVLDPISADTYKENLVGKKFEYDTGTSIYTLNFISDTNIELTMPTYSEDSYTTGTTKATIDYTISDGKVSITPDENSSIQVFDTTDSYFESAYAGDLDISEDFSTVNILLRTRPDSQNDQYNYNYNNYSFKKPTDLSSIVGKSYQSQTNVYGKDNSTLTINFGTDYKGNMSLIGYDGIEFATLTFDYSVDVSTNNVSLTNVVFTKNTYDALTFNSASMYDKNNLNIRFDVAMQYGSLDATFRIDLRTAL